MKPVPTAHDLVRMGREYAIALSWTKATKAEPSRPAVVQITDKGHALIGQVMRENVEESRQPKAAVVAPKIERQRIDRRED